MDAYKAIDLIYRYFGTDEASGRYVGYSGRYFESLRNKRGKISRRASELFIFKAQQLKARELNVARTREEVSV